jgi:hypothetical protein
MSGQLHGKPAHIVVRCGGHPDGKTCSREQAVVSCDDGVGIRVVTVVDDEALEWLTSFGWCFVESEARWLCPFCSALIRDWKVA